LLEAGLCPVVHRVVWPPCRAGPAATMAHRRPGVVAASAQRRLWPAGILTYPPTAMTPGRAPTSRRDCPATGWPARPRCHLRGDLPAAPTG